MRRGVVGVIVTGGGGAPFDALGVEGDAALAPFAGKYRFLDLAFATMANSRVSAVWVAGGAASPALRAHLANARTTTRARRGPVLRATGGGADRPRATRLLEALEKCREAVGTSSTDTVVALSADHVLQVDLRPLVHAHRESAADVTLVTLPASMVDSGSRPRLQVHDDGRVLALVSPEAPCDGDHAVWTGDLVVRASALPHLLAAAADAPIPVDDADLLARAAAHCTVGSFDPFQPGARGPARGPYWHDPATLEDYYAAQMDLCTPLPRFDLHDAGWPLPAVASGFGPAKVVADSGGRAGQALNTLVADGCLIRGAVVFNTVLGHGVVVESGAEVEDSVLLEGCRIGACARVRRAVVGPGAVVSEGHEIGFGAPPMGATLAPSGLTLVPPPDPAPTTA